MKRKFLASALSLLFVLMTVFSVGTIPAAAEEGDVAVAKIGDVTYTDLAAAVEAAQSGAVITVLKDCSGTGIGTFADTNGGTKTGVKNFTIDFGGFTYTCTGPAVGSSGTESQAFHLEKGGDVILKNGTIKTVTGSQVKMLVNNYCNLTLEDMTLDGTSLNDTTSYYTLSNNFGDVIITGNTNIIAHEGGNAFDIWYGMSESYYDGVSVTFDKDFSGTVSGNIEYGAKPGKGAEQENWTQKAKLVIQAGNFETTLSKGSSTDGLNLKDANISITGGTFSDLSALDYAADGATIKLGKNVTLTGPITITKGLTLDLNGKTITATTDFTSRAVTVNASDKTVTVIDSSTSKAGKIDTTYGAFKVEAGTLNLGTSSGTFGGTYTNSKENWACVKAVGSATINAYSASVTSTTGGCFAAEASTDADNVAKLNIYGGTYTQNEYSDFVSAVIGIGSSAKLNISGGTFTSTGGQSVIAGWNSGATVNITGGTFTANGNHSGTDTNVIQVDAVTSSVGSDVPYMAPTWTISGGTFNGTLLVNSSDEASLPTGFSITGGTFSSDPSAYKAAGYAVSQSNGAYTVYLPYSGGGSTKEETPEPIDAGNVPAVVEDGQATVDADDDALNTIVEDAAQSGTLTLDLSKAGDDVKTATVPAATFTKLAETVKDETSAAKSVTISLPKADVTLDAAALETVAGAAGTDKDVSLTVEEVAKDALPAEQQALVGDALVLDLSLTVDGEKVSDFGGGSVAVTVPYTPKEGQKAEDLVVWFLSDDGKLTPCEGSYDPATGKYTFTTTHFSKYVLGYFPFTDVADSAWYYENVVYAYTEGLMNGTSDTTFTPEGGVNRAMLVTVLWRLEGEPAAEDAGFTDLAQDWYKTAVNWAAANELVTGYGEGVFAPEDALTREQLVTILYRYAAFKGYDTTAAAELSAFTDSAAISDWASAAVSWAAGAKLVNGSDGGFQPAAGAQRAQLAAVFQRFLTVYAT